MQKTLSDAMVCRLNAACVEIMRLSAAQRRDCMREKGGCMGIGWCKAVYKAACMRKKVDDGKQS